MKVLVFHIGPDRYALRLPLVARVLPAASLKAVPLAPGYVAGLLDLHGEPVPVIDLSRLCGVAPEQVWFDTRIILVHYLVHYQAPDTGAGGWKDTSIRTLGLLAEHVIGIDTIDEGGLVDAGVAGAPFLGQVAGAEGGLLQLVELDQLLSPDVRAQLFPAREAVP